MDVPINVIDLLDLKKFLETRHRCFEAILKRVDEDISQRNRFQTENDEKELISIIDTLQ